MASYEALVVKLGLTKSATSSEVAAKMKEKSASEVAALKSSSSKIFTVTVVALFSLLM
jgi:hypothetical protein